MRLQDKYWTGPERKDGSGRWSSDAREDNGEWIARAVGNNEELAVLTLIAELGLQGIQQAQAPKQKEFVGRISEVCAAYFERQGDVTAGGTLVVVETFTDNGTEWGVSFGGPNPPTEEYVAVPDRETAYKLVELIEGRQNAYLQRVNCGEAKETE